MVKILVCGGRDFARVEKNAPNKFPSFEQDTESKKQYEFVMRTLNDIAKEFSKEVNENDNWLPIDITIISGMAKGADSAGADWAIISWAKVEPYPADWNKYKNAAGPIRNQQMLDEGKPDLVVAFPGGKGTADMMRRARKAGVPVREIQYDKT